MESVTKDIDSPSTRCKASVEVVDILVLLITILVVFGLVGCNSGSGGDSNTNVSVAFADSATTVQNTSVVIPVLQNVQLQEGVSYDIAIVSQPSYGTVSIEPDNTIAYLPDANFAGKDKFTYEIRDSAGRSARGIVTLAIRCPDCPDINITLTWLDNPGAKGYVVNYGDSPDNTTQEVGNVPLALFSINLGKELGLRGGETLCFKVTAYSTKSVSPPSTPICGTL